MNTVRKDALIITLLNLIHRALSRIEGISMVIASLCVIGMMFVTAADVGFRYLADAPLAWWYDVLMHYILVATFFFGFSYTLAHHGHLAVEYFADKLPIKVHYFFLAIGFGCAALVLAIIAFTTVEQWYTTWAQADVHAGVILWPVWPAKAIVALGVIPLTLRVAHMCLGFLIAIFSKGALAAIGLQAPVNELDKVTS